MSCYFVPADCLTCICLRAQHARQKFCACLLPFSSRKLGLLRETSLDQILIICLASNKARTLRLTAAPPVSFRINIMQFTSENRQQSTVKKLCFAWLKEARMVFIWSHTPSSEVVVTLLFSNLPNALAKMKSLRVRSRGVVGEATALTVPNIVC